MASMSMVEQLEEQPPVEKPRIDNPEELGEIANPNEAGLPKSVKMTEHKESRTSTTIMDLIGNIWTRLIGCLAFFFIFLWFFTGPDTHIQYQMIAVLLGLALATIVVLLWDKFTDKLYRPLHAGIFSCMGSNVTETSTTTVTVDFPRSLHCKLPAELDREIFLFLKPAAQRKFIYGLGWNFYAMFRYRLLTKTKRVRNPTGNGWTRANFAAIIVTANGLNISDNFGAPNVFAAQSFPVSGPLSRMDDFPGTILYYYEVEVGNYSCFVGISDSAIPGNSLIGEYSNSYAIHIVGHPCYGCRLAGERHRFELPVGAIRPKIKHYGNVYGCGLVLDPEDKLWIFFTFNGQLFCRKISICPTVDRLFPAVSMIWNESSVKANFGDDPAKPFEYDIQSCPGLGLACV